MSVPTNARVDAGNLWDAMVRQSAHALACGALHPATTSQTRVVDQGVEFLVRQVSSLARKEQAAAAPRPANADPFLPCEADLVVGDLSDTHIAVLNKFNVIEHHLLIVTRDFEPQEAWLGLADFEAQAQCLAAFDGLAFYNGGQVAGASQPHKHLQIVPLPLGDTAHAIPIEAALQRAASGHAITTVPGLPFRHAFTRVDFEPHDARAALERYRALLDAVGITGLDGALQSAPYNLLATRRWMLLVPRSAERVEGVQLNALGFAGSLFVRDAAQWQIVERLGPMNVLRGAAWPI